MSAMMDKLANQHHDFSQLTLANYYSMVRQRGSNFSTFEKMLVTELKKEFGVTAEDERTDSSCYIREEGEELGPVS